MVGPGGQWPKEMVDANRMRRGGARSEERIPVQGTPRHLGCGPPPDEAQVQRDGSQLSFALLVGGAGEGEGAVGLCKATGQLVRAN